MPDVKDDLDRRWNDLGDFIREQRAIGELSLRKLSERAGVSNPYLSQIERGLRRPSAEILQQIARALEISAETLYVRAGILDEPAEKVNPVGEIRRDPRITEEQKKTLIHIYESFLRENGTGGAEEAEVPVGSASASDRSPGPASEGADAADDPAGSPPPPAVA
jgi:transcriptional regulator with XRE-family HTH domain